MNDKLDLISKFTDDSIAKNDLEQASNITEIIRMHYDVWVVVLKPMLKRQNKSFYKEIMKIFILAGYSNVYESQLRTSFNRVKNERAKEELLKGDSNE